MIYTSYFAAMRRMTEEQKFRCVCIALWPPKGVNIPIYSNLAPTKKFCWITKRILTQRSISRVIAFMYYQGLIHMKYMNI